MSHRFLFFSPYAAWSYHTHLEVTWAHALRIRGHHVDFVACDGLFGACDLYRHILSKRDEGSCRHCQIQVLKLYKGLHNPTHWLGRFIPDGRREAIDAWSASVPADEILTAEWAGQPVGQWSQSTSFSHFRCSELDTANPEMVAVFREQMRSTALAMEGIDAALDALKPETVVLINGRFFAHWVMIERCKQRGIRFVTHERGMRKNTVRFAEQGRTHELHLNQRMWDTWRDVPLSAEELASTRQFLLDRRYGRNASWLSFSPPPQEAERIREAYRLDDRPILAVFNSSPDEVVAFPDRREGAFPKAGQFLSAVKDLAIRHPEWQVVVQFIRILQVRLG